MPMSPKMGSVPVSRATGDGLARRGSVAPAIVGIAVIGLALVAVSGAFRAPPLSVNPPGSEVSVGLTKVATSSHYIVVLNIVPPEEMFLPDEAATRHPTEGELILRGNMAPIGPDSRHAEAHVYDKATGRARSDVTPIITLVDQTSGRTQTLEATLMQDVALGPRDIHFGNNVGIPAGHEFTIAIDLGGETITFSGTLP